METLKAMAFAPSCPLRSGRGAQGLRLPKMFTTPLRPASGMQMMHRRIKLQPFVTAVAAPQKSDAAPKASKKLRSKKKHSGADNKEQFVIKKTGMNSAVVLSKDLQEICGVDMMRRSLILSSLADYIKDHNLHSRKTQRYFVCDEKLSRMFGVDGEHPVLRLHKFVVPHVKRPAEAGPQYEQRAEQMFAEYLKSKGAVASTDKSRMKDARGWNSSAAQRELKRKGRGMYAPVIIAPSLRPICDGKETLSRPQAVKCVWNYIKKHGLQDAKDKRQINFDTGLAEALQVGDLQSVDCFHISALIVKLFTKSD